MVAHAPSSHAAVLHLPDRRRARAGTFVRLAHRRLGQSHAFAAIPDPDGNGYRVIVPRAGDWTAELIDSPPGRIRVRGAPVDGVASVARLFRRVVWIATGSGIAPCLPHLLAHDGTRSHLVRVTRNPLRTYGSLLDEIRAAVPTPASGTPTRTANPTSPSWRRTPTGARAPKPSSVFPTRTPPAVSSPTCGGEASPPTAPSGTRERHASQSTADICPVTRVASKAARGAGAARGD